MEIYNAFPTPIGVVGYDREISPEMIDAVKMLGIERDELNSISTDTDILRTIPELNDLYGWLNGQLNAYFRSIYAPLNDIEVYITHSWATFTKENEGHHMHTHQNSFISGVFYIKAKDVLSFHKSDGYNFFDIPAKTWNQYNSPIVNVDAVTGQLILFPSKMLHSVPHIQYDDERIAIAFNSFLRGNLGISGNKTELNL